VAAAKAGLRKAGRARRNIIVYFKLWRLVIKLVVRCAGAGWLWRYVTDGVVAEGAVLKAG